MSVRLLVVEDEPAIQALLALNLERAGYEVRCAATAHQAQSMIDEVLPDLILLDWMLPDLPGVRLARHLRTEARTSDIPLIMLTARATEQDAVDGLEAGADDYVTKPFSSRELLARIRSLLRRRSPQLAGDPVELEGLRLDPGSRRVSFAGQELPMGPAEFRLLNFLMNHAGRVFSRAQLLDLVWGDHVHVEERTVDVHVRRLRKALEPAACGHLVRTVRGAGYGFGGASPA